MKLLKIDISRCIARDIYVPSGRDLISASRVEKSSERRTQPSTGRLFIRTFRFLFATNASFGNA